VVRDQRSTVVVVAGLAAHAAHVVADQLMTSEPDTVVVHHDPRSVNEGVVRRTVRTAEDENATALELARCCLSCTLREDILGLVRDLGKQRRYGRIVLHLDPALEPESVCWGLAHILVDDDCVTDHVDIEAVITTIDRASWLGQATSDEPLPELASALGDTDDRTLAQVAVGQVEFADIVVHSDAGPDATDTATKAVLDRLAPLAAQTSLERLDCRTVLASLPAQARRGAVDDAHGPLLRGQPPLDEEAGVAVTLFDQRRPFHPERLHHTLDALLHGVVRTRGRTWIASQPDAALWMESPGGGMRVSYTEPWLAELGGAERADVDWEALHPDHRTRAALRWLVIITHPADPQPITDRLRAALLTDAELADGEQAWRTYPDPFDGSQNEESDMDAA
jgi:G3E family GTPase